jgi:hypothetical protein
MALAIPGLPDGVVCTKIGIATPDEFELTRSPTGDVEITKGPRAGSGQQIIVEPSPDFEFLYDLRSLTFRPVKKLAKPMDLETTVKFTVTNQVQMDLIQDRLAALKELPGFQGMK